MNDINLRMGLGEQANLTTRVFASAENSDGQLSGTKEDRKKFQNARSVHYQKF